MPDRRWRVRQSNLHAYKLAVGRGWIDCSYASSLVAPGQHGKHRQTKDDTMCRGRCGGGRVRGKQPVGVIHGVGGVSMRVGVDASARGWIG